MRYQELHTNDRDRLERRHSLIFRRGKKCAGESLHLAQGRGFFFSFQWRVDFELAPPTATYSLVHPFIHVWKDGDYVYPGVIKSGKRLLTSVCHLLGVFDFMRTAICAALLALFLTKAILVDTLRPLVISATLRRTNGVTSRPLILRSAASLVAWSEAATTSCSSRTPFGMMGGGTATTTPAYQEVNIVRRG